MKSSINRLIKLIPEWNGKSIKVNPIDSGITNINFEVIVDEKSFFLSMPSSNSELLDIDYKNKYYNNKICGEINISPRVIHFIESENLLITEFIKSKVSLMFQLDQGELKGLMLTYHFYMLYHLLNNKRQYHVHIHENTMKRLNKLTMK